MQLFSHPCKTWILGRALGLSLLGLTALGVPTPSAADSPAATAASTFRPLMGHIPRAVSQAQAVSTLEPTRTLPMALTLPLRNQDELADLLRGLTDPNDARYGQYLTPQEFTARFSPTQADYNRAIAYARSVGLTVVDTHSNRTVLDVVASAAQAERAFGLHLLVYQSSQDGRYFFAPDAEPRVPAAVASVVTGVIGLDNAAQWHPHLRVQPVPAVSPLLDPFASPAQTGSGPGGGLTPSDIKKAYNLSGVGQTGSGQTLALFELAGYTPSDITAYESVYGLPAVPLQNVLVDGYSGAPGNGADEVTLDIELQIALAPGAAKILVYEGPNTSKGVVDTYTRIATDNLAKSISTSWGAAERSSSATTRNGENTAFQQMAAQGQSIFAASGDSGAYDNGSSLSVDDPASQPYMTGVGGTSLTTSGAGGAYSSEKTWNGGSIAKGGGGGGISTVWAIPSYQSGLAGSAASKGSATMRNVPDVSLDSDPNTGYSIYYSGNWYIFGGTSCAAPLWSAFAALVNQQRVANGLGTLGFANTPLYALAKTTSYSADFNDIADGSTNLFYPAVAGYDDATGLGTFNGANLLADLSDTAASATPMANAISITTGQDTPVAVTLAGSDPNSRALTYTVVTSPMNGTLSGTAPNLTYTPNVGYYGSDSFTFTVSNRTYTSAPATVSLSVTQAPIVLSSLAFASPVVGGTVLNATVTLSGVTPTDLVVGTSSSDSSVVRIFRSVIVPAGSSSATFAINTFRSHFNQTVTIQATLGSVVKTQDLTITGR